MRKLILFLIAVSFSVYLPAQSIVAFHEDFELPSSGDSVNSSTNPSGGVQWAISTNLKNSGLRADTVRVQASTSVYLTTNSFSTIGYAKTYLKFAHICKVYYADGGYVEVSTDNGLTWTTLTQNEYRSTATLVSSKFSESSYLDWLPGDTTIKPSNLWWKTELFDISNIAANKANVIIRFSLFGSGNPLGNGRYGWLLDDIKVIAAPNEIFPPKITNIAPVYKDTVYVTGPLKISEWVTDSSALGNVNLIYSVNGGNNTTLTMTNVSDSLYTADLGSFPYNSVLCYSIQAADIYNNQATLPTAACQQFVLSKGIPNVQIGTGTSNGTITPIYTTTTAGPYYSYYATVLTSSQIKSGGTIESVAFNKSDVNGYTSGNGVMRIYAKAVGDSIAPSSWAAYTTAKANAIKIYESTTQNLNTSIGWQTFSCNTGLPFQYTGCDHILLFVEFYRPGAVTGTIAFQNSTVPNQASIFYGVNSVPSASNTSGLQANVKLNFESSTQAIDAKVSSYINLGSSITANTLLPVNVTIKNLGTTAITSARVAWAVDGVYQGAVNVTGINLLQDYTSANISLGNYSFPFGSHTVKAWTELPNNSVDQTPANDTLTTTLFACQNLNGNYTVGNANSNFPTFNDVFTAISSCGISGPVVFKIKTGTYNQQLTIPYIANTSATNTITFESESGVQSDVVLSYAATGTGDNYTLKLDGSQFVKIKNITIKATGTIYAYAVLLASAASNITIEGCRIESGTTSSSSAGIYNGNSAIENYNTIKNNTIINGYYGIYLSGSSTIKEKGNIITGNTINNFYYYGLYSSYQDSILVTNNNITNPLNTTAYGSNIINTDNAQVLKNRIVMNAASTNYCLYFSTNNSAGGKSIIANNFVSQTAGTATVYGIYNTSSNNMKYYYNSVNITAGTTTSYGFYVSANIGIVLKNNIVSNTGGGYTLYVTTAAIAAIDTSDYNDFYATGTNLAFWGVAKATLGDLQTASGKDLNSKNINPVYYSVSDLHVTNYALAATGNPVGIITDDIDGELRADPPCIGADEFIIPQNDAGVAMIKNPISPIISQNQNIRIVLKNYGIQPLTSSTIKFRVNGVLQTPYSWTGNLAMNTVDTVTIGSFIFGLGNNVLKVYSEQPNNVADLFNYNDTSSMIIYACSGPMNGSYTIGGTGASFPSVTAAITALINCGVNGPTIFNINAGTYTDQFLFPLISGVSAANTITFKAANNDSSSVIFNSITSLGNFVAKFDAAQYINLDKLTLINTTTTGRVIEFINASKYISISNCAILSYPGATSTTAAPIYSSNTKDEHITISNNQIIGGYYGIYMVSTSAGKEVGNAYLNNVIKDFYYAGIYTQYQDSIRIIGNSVQNHPTGSIIYGAYPYYCDNAQILKNKINVIGTSTAYCLYLFYNNVTAGNSLVANNFISQSVGAISVYGIYSSSTSNVNYYNNSVNVTKGNTSAYAFYITNGANCNIVNNNFSNTGGGYAFYANNTTGVNTSNYNNLFVTGTNLAYWTAARTNLAALQAASGKDANSISTNPIYNNLTDLHTDNVNLYAKGTSLSQVTDDIDGQIRASSPCIGADEFVLLPNDAKVRVIYTLGKMPLVGVQPHTVKAVVKNNGYNKLYNIPITLNITGANTFTSVITRDSILPGVDDTIAFAGFTPTSIGNNNVKVSVPNDDLLSNNEIQYFQKVTDSVLGYADTAIVRSNYGFGSGSGLLLSKFSISGLRIVKSVNAYITGSNTIGQTLYGVILNSNGTVLDTSLYKTITAADTNNWVTFNFSNLTATTIVNSDFYIGIAQRVGTGAYNPLGTQTEIPTRKTGFYTSASFTGGVLVENTQNGRFMIEANLGFPANKDASVNQIITPVEGCGLANEIVKIKILNVGTDTIWGGQNVLTAHYAIKQNGVLYGHVSQQVTDTIIPSFTKDFTFTTPVNLSVTLADSNFKLIAWVDLANDPFKSNDTLLKTVLSRHIPSISVVTNPVNINFNASATLNAITTDTAYWYSNAIDTIPIASGLNFTTPILSDTVTYWVEASSAAISNSSSQFVGPANTSIGSGGAAGANSYNLIFDVLNPSGITIKNVDVYPSTSGTPFVMVVKNSSGTIIQSFNGISTTSGGVQTLNVNFQIPYGTAYTLGFTSGPNFYRNISGATFPYTIPGLVSITGTSFVGYPAYYYVAYNWEVITNAGNTIPGCKSPRIPVVVNVAPGKDASVTKLLTPNTGCGLSNQVVKVRIKNKGNQPIIGSQNVLTAHYGILFNGNLINVINQQVPNTILIGDSLDFTFSTLLTLPAYTADSNYTLVAWNTLINDLVVSNDSVFKTVKSKYTPSSPSVSNQTITYGTTATFNVVSNDSISWYSNINDSIPFATGSQFTTPALYDTTTYYVKAGQLIIESNLGLTAISAHSSGGATTLNGPNKYNDGVISVYNTNDWGWVYQNGWIEYTWSNPVTFNKVVFFKDNRPMTTCTFQYWNGTSYVDFYSYNNSNIDDSVVFPAVSSTKLRFNNVVSPDVNPNFREIQVFAVGSCSSPLVPVTAIVTNIPALDIATASITQPGGAVNTSTSYPVKAKIINHGNTTITSATVNWSVNGTLMTPFTFSNTLINGQTSAELLLGNTTFISGYNTIKVWTSNPNASLDGYPLNDTITKTLLGCLSGTFTIGAGKTFPNFNTALSALDIAGVCGNVVFVVDTGMYNERLIITHKPGMGPNATVSFTSASADSNHVVLHYATSSNKSTLIKFSNARYFNFNKIKLSVSGGSFYGHVIELADSSNHIEVSNCVLEGLQANLTGNHDYDLIYATGPKINNNLFKNNLFLNGVNAIYLYGTNTDLHSKNSIIGNTIKDAYFMGIYLYYQDSISVLNNTIQNILGSGTFYGVCSYYSSNLNIQKNKLNLTANGIYGIFVSGSNSTIGGNGIIANNFISQSVGGTSSVYGLYSSGNFNLNICYNTVNITSGGSANNNAFYITSGAGNNILNNIFANTGGGYAYYNSSAGVLQSNNNDLYTSGANIGYFGSACSTLAAFKLATGKDQNSINVLPNFNSLSDLHLIMFDLNAMGMPIAGITDDIDGDLRNATTPDIGADEFNLPINDAGIVEVKDPISPTTLGSQAVKVVLRNFGNNNLTSASIRWSVDGIIQTNYPWTGNLISGAKDTVNIGSYNFTAGHSNLIKVWATLPNGGVDGLATNDTAVKVVIACNGGLTGNYTVGGSGANYMTLNSAVQALNSCGVSGAVTFNVNPGTYTEQFVIGAITGASSTNRITFQSANGDSTSVKIGFDYTQTGNNYVAQIAGAQYITLTKMTFIQTNLSSGRVITFTGNPSNIIIANNHIEIPANTIGITAGIVTLNSDFGNDNMILNNYISGGYNGIETQGSSSVTAKRNIFAGNIVKDFYYCGIQADYQDSLNIRSNMITCNSGALSKRAISITSASNNLYIEKNKININSYGYNTNGIYISNSTGTTVKPQLITNNFISMYGTSGYGIYLSSGNYVNIANNSLNVELYTLGSSSAALFIIGGGNNNLYNNNVVALNSTYTVYAATNSVISNSDYNNFYKNSTGNFAYWGAIVADLPALKALNTKDINSVSIDPSYISNTDLHVYTSAMNNTGKPITIVVDDIDGQPRSTTSPDIGADEFSTIQYDLSVTTILNPYNKFAQSGTTIPVKIRIMNYGTDSVANFNVVCKFGNAIPASYLYSGVLHANQADTITFINQAILSGPFEIKTYTSLSTDLNHNNDTIKMSYYGVAFKSLPYAENFDNTNSEWFSLESNTLWQKGAPSSSMINTAHSSPNVWKTNLSGNYVNSISDTLYTPIFDNSVFKADSMMFWHWVNSELNKDGGYIEYTSDGSSWSLLGHIVPADTNATNWYNGTISNWWTGSFTTWQQSKYKVKNLNTIGNVLQFRFIFASDATNSAYNGWAIDDFKLTLAPIPADGGVINIVNPVTSLLGDTVYPKVTVKNFGTSTLTSIPVKYSVNGQLIATETFNTNLIPGATADYTFNQYFKVLTQPNYTLKAFTAVTGDYYTSADSTIKVINVSPAVKDLGILRILTPTDTVSTGSVVTVSIRIKNFGTQAVTSVPVFYQRGTQPIVNETWNGPALNIGDSATYTFTSTFTVPLGSSFSFNAGTNFAADAYNNNNKITKFIIISGTLPGNAGSITSNSSYGGDTVCFPTSGAVPVTYIYTVPNIGNATNYVWSYSGTNVSFSPNDTTSTGSVSITFNTNATSGNLTVFGYNAAASGNASPAFAVTVIQNCTIGIEEDLMNNFWLSQNMPNPTSGATNIEYSLPQAGDVKFDIMNLYGQKVYSTSSNNEAGKHIIDLNIKDLANGVYYYTIEFKGKRLVKKMVLNK